MNKERDINILAIETSCDETAAAVVTNGNQIRSSIVASQIELHQKYGGVVPEIASRAHMENIYPVISEALEKSGLEIDDIDAVAVANQPGLVGALIVGVTAAKSMAFMWNKPLIGVNHVHAHMQSAMLETEELELPAIALVVSGGHTNLYNCKSALELELVGSTIDDAAGEAFDKVAAILGLTYPGGPVIEGISKNANPKAVRFPRSMMAKESLDFSFSGIKTAVLYHCYGQDMNGTSQVSKMSEQEIADIAASFQAAVIEVLVKKTMRAADRFDAETVLLGGGVAASGALRAAMEKACIDSSRIFRVAERKYCTDNAVMIGSLAWHKYKAELFADMSLEASASA